MPSLHQTCADVHEILRTETVLEGELLPTEMKNADASLRSLGAQDVEEVRLPFVVRDIFFVRRGIEITVEAEKEFASALDCHCPRTRADGGVYKITIADIARCCIESIESISA